MDTLPNEILKEIFSFTAQTNLKLVCSRWREVVRRFRTPFEAVLHDDPVELSSWWEGSKLQNRLFKNACLINSIKCVKWVVSTGYKRLSSGWGIASLHRNKEITKFLKSLGKRPHPYTFTKHSVRCGKALHLALEGYSDELSYLEDVNVIRRYEHEILHSLNETTAKGVFVTGNKEMKDYYFRLSEKYTILAGLKYAIKRSNRELLDEMIERAIGIEYLIIEQCNDINVVKLLLDKVDIQKLLYTYAYNRNCNIFRYLLDFVTEIKNPRVLILLCDNAEHGLVEEVLNRGLCEPCSLVYAHSTKMVKILLRYGAKGDDDRVFSMAWKRREDDLLKDLLQRGYIAPDKIICEMLDTHHYWILEHIKYLSTTVMRSVCVTLNIIATRWIKKGNITFDRVETLKSLNNYDSIMFFLLNFVEDLPDFCSKLDKDTLEKVSICYCLMM